MTSRPRLWFAMLLLPLAGFAQQESATPLKRGQPVDVTLGAHEIANFVVDLPENRFVYAEVVQKSVDVRVVVRGPDGAAIGTYDGPARGAEPIQFETAAAGRYRFEVRPFEDASGDFAILLRRVENIARKPRRRLDQLLTRFAGDDRPGAVVAVIEDGSIVHSQAVGMANLTFGIPFQRDTVSNIGSVSKQFTAMAVVLLAQSDKISLDDDVRAYFPTLPDLGHVVTVRHLLNHTSGYREFLNLLAMTGVRIGEGDYIDRDSVLELLERQPEFQDLPGSRFNYNNSAYTLAALLVEQVTETPFSDWIRANVFEPLGMDDTRVRSFTGEIVPRAADGYVYAETAPYRHAVDLGGGGGATMGPGGIYSTVADLARWMANLDSGELGGKAAASLMMTPTIDVPGGEQYGLGLFIGEHRGQRYVEHGGADTAHRAQLLYFPDIRAGVVALSNNGAFDANRIAFETADAFFADRFEPEEAQSPQLSDTAPSGESGGIDLSAYDAVLGRYELVDYPGVVFELLREGDTLSFVQGTEEAVEMAPVTATSLRVSPRQTIHFEPAADGSVDTITVRSGVDLPARRLEPWSPSRESLASYAGRYYSQELRTVYDVELQDDGLAITHERLDDIPLVPKTEDSFTASGVLNEVVFERNDVDRVVAMRVSNVRTMNVRFDRQ